MQALRKDGRVRVLDDKGADVWLYPVDAREAARVGSHTFPKGEEIRGPDSVETEALRRRVQELEAQMASSSATGVAPINRAVLVTPDAPKAGVAARMSEASKQADAVGAGTSK